MALSLNKEIVFMEQNGKDCPNDKIQSKIRTHLDEKRINCHVFFHFKRSHERAMASYTWLYKPKHTLCYSDVLHLKPKSFNGNVICCHL